MKQPYLKFLYNQLFGIETRIKELEVVKEFPAEGCHWEINEMEIRCMKNWKTSIELTIETYIGNHK